MSKPGNTLYKALQEFPRKRITLVELSKFCIDSDNLYEQIKELTDKGFLGVGGIITDMKVGIPGIIDIVRISTQFCRQ